MPSISAGTRKGGACSASDILRPLSLFSGRYRTEVGLCFRWGLQFARDMKTHLPDWEGDHTVRTGYEPREGRGAYREHVATIIISSDTVVFLRPLGIYYLPL